jgi:hypothetical protein
MKFNLKSHASALTESGGTRRFTLFLNAAILLSMVLFTNVALAEKLKLAVFPVNTSMNLSASQKGYLYDAIREAASASAGSYIGILPKQKIKTVMKKKKSCDEECALTSAASIDARIALLVELNQKDSQVVGVVKLLDTREEVLIIVKRFFSASAESAEQELQAAVMFVLSAQYLPLSESDIGTLQAEQQNLPATFAHSEPAGEELHTAPSTPVPPNPPVETTSTENVSYSNTDIAQPEEPVRPNAYLVTAIITGTVGLGMGIGAIVSGVQLGNEIQKRDDQTFFRDQLYNDFQTVDSSNDDPDLVNAFNDRWELYGIDYDFQTVQNALNTFSDNIELTNDAIKQNGIMAGVFGTLAVASLTVSTVFTVKYLRSRKNSGTRALRAPNVVVAPVLSREMNGAVLSASF